MKRFWKAILCISLTISLLVGCGPTSTDTNTTTNVPPAQEQMPYEDRLSYYKTLGTSPDDNYRTWYQILVYTFCDSNGDGIGDLQGVISKLDYLDELGVTGIWLMPIHPSDSPHKYNVNDYEAIDPTYGTMADFEQLISECDRRGIKVILDLVVNHTGDLHPWFLDAVEYLKCLGDGEEGSSEICPHYEFYNFRRFSEIAGLNSEHYNMISGTDFVYEHRFTFNMPDLNLDSPLVREEIRKVMEFWLNKGVAGFRVDAAKEFYAGNVKKNVEFMTWLQDAAESIKPDVYMVAEAWVMDAYTIGQYYQSGFVSMFNFPMGAGMGTLVKTVNSRGNEMVVSQWASNLEKYCGFYADGNPGFIDAMFTSNHDVGRIRNFCRGDLNRMKLAGAMNLFSGGSAFIYYGEEIGIPGGGDDADNRAPMYWADDVQAGVTEPMMDCDLTVQDYPLGSVATQTGDTNSIYSYYRECIAIREALPVIARGKNTVETDLNVKCVSAIRKTWNDETCIMLININEQADTVDLSGYTDWKMVASVSADGSPIVMNGSTLEMAAYGIAILVPNS